MAQESKGARRIGIKRVTRLKVKASLRCKFLKRVMGSKKESGLKIDTRIKSE